MKKLLLMLVALVATVTISAKEGEEMEGWQKSFTPVSDSKELAGIHTAVAGDGSVYASSTYNQDFQFAEKTVAADPDGQTYSCIVKYDKDGNEKWAVTLAGSCTIHAMTADEDGTLYIAGTATDDVKVVLTGTNNVSKEIVIPYAYNILYEMDIISCYPGFVAKISKDGVIENLLVITSATNEEVAMDFDNMYLGMDIISVRPSKIALAGNRVYVAARYMGDVAQLGWKGAYVKYTEAMITVDAYSYGVFGLLKSDFSALGGYANVQQTGSIAETLSAPEAIDFVVYNETPHVAFFGYGNLTLTTTADFKDFTFKKDDNGLEHALVLANVRELNKHVVFPAATHSSENLDNYRLIGASLAGDNCILGGNFYGNFPLDNTVTKDKKTSFVASIKMSDCSVNWAKANEVESEAKCMVVTGEEIKASTDAATYTFKTATGDLDAGQTMEKSFEDADCYNDQYVSTVFIQETSVVVFSPKLKPSGINEAQAQKNGALKYYNVNGVELSAPQKGLNIIKTAEGTRKVVK
jgi:hypothetical protein